MLKSAIKVLSMLVALLLVSSVLVCLAETETETYISSYEPLNAQLHTVYTETWEYPIVDGVRGSGKVIGEGSYTEPHTFGDDDKCVYCGYALPSEVDDDDDDGDSETTGTTATEETVTETNFTTASGVTVEKGTKADETLKKVVESLPADAKISNVDADTAEALLDAINNGVSSEELLEILKDFPIQNVDGIDCYIVAFSYTDTNGNAVTESYAFSTVDGTLVKVF